MSDDEYIFEEEEEGEEWVFDEMDSDEDDSTSSSYSSGSGSYISGVTGPKKSITKFSSSLSREDLNLTPPTKNLSLSAGIDKDLVDLPPVAPTSPAVDSPKEEKKKEKRSLFGKKKSKDKDALKRAASEPVNKVASVEISSPAASPQRPQESKNEDSSSSDESMKDLENQIAALRIIESNGKDTKLLSLRPKRAQTAPNIQAPGSSPFCAAVSNDPRVNIVSEIVTTEQTYVNDLEILIRNYLDPFRFRKAKKSNKPILTQQQIGILFSNIESILNLNQVLLNSLLAQMSLPPEQQRIGAAFSLLAKCLLIYTDYCSNQKDADALYTKLKATNEDFNAILEENIVKPECRRLDLNAFLIKPVQRVCKYPLLLKELLKHTPQTHPDFADLNEAHEAMQNSCLKLNERKREVENMSHFLTIKARTGKNFIESGRRFIQDGNIFILVEKEGKQRTKIKRKEKKGRYVLFSDILVFIYDGKVAAQVPLQNSQILDANLEEFPLAFAFVSRAHKRLLFLPQNEIEKGNLMRLFREKIQELAPKGNFDNLNRNMIKKRSVGSPKGRPVADMFQLDCIYKGAVKKVEIPIDCKRVQILKTIVSRAHALTVPPASVKITFITGENTSKPIVGNDEFLQLLPFTRAIQVDVSP